LATVPSAQDRRKKGRAAAEEKVDAEELPDDAALCRMPLHYQQRDAFWRRGIEPATRIRLEQKAHLPAQPASFPEPGGGQPPPPGPVAGPSARVGPTRFRAPLRVRQARAPA
jgi:hypothetical protein